MAIDAKVPHWDGRWRADSSVPATLDNHSPHGDKNTLRCQSHGDVGESGASDWVASEATLADEHRMHTQHNGGVA
jgi:hypothetical protein